MGGLVINLLLLTMQCVMIGCSKHSFSCVYQPYGTRMCSQLCQDSTDSFCYVLKDLSCHRVSSNESAACHLEDRGTSHSTGCTFATGLNVCNSENEASAQNEDLRVVKPKCNKTLYEACEEGQLEKVKHILSQWPENINCSGWLGRAPIMAAAVGGKLTVFDYLVSEGCNLSTVDDENNTVLHIACMGGNADIVKKLINDKKFDVERGGYRGQTPLMYAACYGRKEVFELLVKKGCSLTVLDDENNNIFHVACMAGLKGMVGYILSLNITGVGIESRGHLGRTPVMVAAENKRWWVFRLLVKTGCNLTAVDDQNNNILHAACEGGKKDIVEWILNKGIVAIESRGLSGRTPLIIAVEFYHKGLVKCLLSHGSNLTAVDNYKNNLLHVACNTGNKRMVEYLLTLKAVEGLVKMENESGYTPIKVAEKRGFAAVAKLLRSI